jgi:hypothetical protein
LLWNLTGCLDTEQNPLGRIGLNGEPIFSLVCIAFSDSRQQTDCRPPVLQVSQLHRAHRTEALELINFYVLWSGSLVRHRWSWIHHLSTRLRLPGCLLRRKRSLVNAELLLPSDVDLILRRSGKHVEQFPVVLDSRHSVPR